jgi:hypothetical protein
LKERPAIEVAACHAVVRSIPLRHEVVEHRVGKTEYRPLGCTCEPSHEGSIVDEPDSGSFDLDATQIEEPQELDALGVEALVSIRRDLDLCGQTSDADSIQEVELKGAPDECRRIEATHHDLVRLHHLLVLAQARLVVVEAREVLASPFCQPDYPADLHALLIAAHQVVVLPPQIHDHADAVGQTAG